MDATAQAAFLLGEWAPVTSSNVKEARYDAEMQVLEVGYIKNGKRYPYKAVSPEMADAFARAGSQGVWLHANVIGFAAHDETTKGKK